EFLNQQLRPGADRALRRLFPFHVFQRGLKTTRAVGYLDVQSGDYSCKVGCDLIYSLVMLGSRRALGGFKLSHELIDPRLIGVRCCFMSRSRASRTSV